jgi:hypothetical protein
VVSSDSRTRRVVLLLYVPALVGVAVAALARARPRSAVGLAMALLAFAVLFVDWAETRRLLARLPPTRRARALTVALTLPLLAVWVALGTVALAPARLPLYFGLLAGVFFLRAVRDATVLGLSPLALLDRGYPNLVAVYLVLGAAAETVDRFQLGLVVLAGLVAAVRASFRWTETVRGWLAGQ